MVCKNCGAQLDEGSKFCGICGTKVEDNEQVQVNDVASFETEVVDNSSLNPVEIVDSSVNEVEKTPDMGTGVSPIEASMNSSEKPKKSFVGPIIGIIAVLLIVGGIYCYFNNKKRAVKNIINNVYDKFESLSIENDINEIKDKSVLVSGDFSITTNIPELMDLSGEKLNYTFGIDYPNKKMEMGASLEENGLKIIDAAMYIVNNSAYVSLKDDFDKLIKVDVEGIEDIFNSTSNSNLSEADIKYLVKSYKDILIDSIDSSDLVKSTATITLDGKDTKVTKLTYDMTSQRAAKLVNNIIDGTLKDSRLLEILSSLSGSSVDELKDELKSSKITDTSDLGSGSVTFDIYTKGFNNTFVGMDIQGIIQIRKNSDNVTIEAGVGTEKISLVIKKLDDNSCIIELNSNVGGEVIKGSLSISSKEISSNNYQGTIILNIAVGETYLNMTSNFTEVYGADVASIDVSGAVDVNSLTMEDQNRISESLGNKLMNSKLYKLVESIQSSRNSYYDDYDYDYDFDNYDFSDYDFDF